MKLRWIVSALAALSLAGVAHAEERPWYVGVKVGVASFDAGDFAVLELVDALFGYRFAARDWGSIAFEAEYATSFSDADAVLGFIAGRWEAETWAGYLAYRGPKNVYFKGKAGYLDSSAELSYQLICLVPPCDRGLLQLDDAGVSSGIGVGWRVGNKHSLELEWTHTLLDHDLDTFSLGFNF